MFPKALFLISTIFLFGCSQQDSSAKLEEEIELEETVKLEPEAAAFSCPHHETRDIFFTSKDKTDILDLSIVGSDCDTARIIIKIITAAGNVVHQTEARALDYTYEDVGAQGVQWMLERLVLSDSIADALVAYDYDLSERNGYSKVDPAAVARIKNGQAPLFCHQAGKSYSNCYIYGDGASIFAFSTGS